MDTGDEVDVRAEQAKPEVIGRRREWSGFYGDGVAAADGAGLGEGARSWFLLRSLS